MTLGNWTRATHKPPCPKCGDERQVEPLAGLSWFCNCCGSTFDAKPPEPQGLHRREG